jgi:hypothetical protein
MRSLLRLPANPSPGLPLRGKTFLNLEKMRKAKIVPRNAKKSVGSRKAGIIGKILSGFPSSFAD